MVCTQEELKLLESYGVYNVSKREVDLQVVEMLCKMFASVVSNCPLCTEAMRGTISEADLEALGKTVTRLALSKATSVSENCIESIASSKAWRKCFEAVKDVLKPT